VWENNNAGLNLYGARITTAGAVLDTRTEGAVTVGGVAISTAADSQQAPSIRCQATGCLVAWQDRRNINTTGFDVFAQRINLDFTLAGPDFAISNVTGSQFAPEVASSGSSYFVAWHDLRDNAAFAVFGSTVSTAGAVGAAAALGTGNNRETGPTLGRAGSILGLFWSDSRNFSGGDIQYIRFNSSGTKLDTTARTASNATFTQFTPSASTDLGANAFVVWADTRNGANRDIFGARIALSTGTTVDGAGIALSTAAGDQIVPAVASNGALALTVWQDRRSGTTFDVFGTLVDSGGAVIAADIAISQAAADQTRPAVAWDNVARQFIVVWEDSRSGVGANIMGARVAADGTVLDPAGVVVGAGASARFAPAIASTASGTFAVWQDRRNAPAGGYNIFGTRLTAGTSLFVVDSVGIRISNNPSKQSQPAIGNLGSGYLVVWADDRNTQSDIFGQQLTATGALTGTEFAIASTTDSELAPTLIGTGGTESTLRVAYEAHRLDSSRVGTRLISTALSGGSVCSSAAACDTGFCVDGYCCDSACGGNHVPPSGTNAGDCHACANKYTGRGNGTCAPLPSTSICRNYASTFCDIREYCDGTSLACGANVGRNQGLACNRATNTPPGTGTGVCPSNAPPGPHFCI
jgi:hypothetical protein